MGTRLYQRKQRGLQRRLSALGLVIIILALFTAGCGEKNRPGTDAGGSKVNEGPKKAAEKAQSSARGTEAEARTVVNTALDSWVFGDSEEQFKKAHPGIHFLDFNRITHKLGRYEIGAMRPAGNSFEFQVTLIYKEESGDVIRSGNYTVVKNAEGEWEIFGGAN